MIEILTKWQQERFDEFEEAIHRKKSLFRSAELRQIGKTYILNELGFELQALGYKVYVYTPFAQLEYFAERFIHDYMNIRELDKINSVIIFDEAKMDSEETSKIVEYCLNYKIPMVGYVRYPVTELPEFKTEYECEWNKD